MKNYLTYLNAEKVDGILADLGVSSFQLNEGERGFSYRFDAELDMRMDREQKLSAASLLNEYSQTQINEVLKNYGEINQSYKISI